MEGESGEQVGGELESLTSSAGCFVQGWLNETGSWFLFFDLKFRYSYCQGRFWPKISGAGPWKCRLSKIIQRHNNSRTTCIAEPKQSLILCNVSSDVVWDRRS